MNDLERLRAALQEQLPEASLAMDPSPHPQGTWFLDVSCGEKAVTIEWSPSFDSFRVTWAQESDGPDEMSSGIEETAKRIVALSQKEA